MQLFLVYVLYDVIYVPLNICVLRVCVAGVFNCHRMLIFNELVPLSDWSIGLSFFQGYDDKSVKNSQEFRASLD